MAEQLQIASEEESAPVEPQPLTLGTVALGLEFHYQHVPTRNPQFVPRPVDITD